MNHKPTLDFLKRHGVQTLELEPGPHTPPHIGEQDLTFGIFDGFALAIYDSDPVGKESVTEPRFIKLTYPKLREINVCEYYRDHIRQYRFAGRIEPESELFPEDAAVCLSALHEVTLPDFESSLKMGLAQLGKCPKRLHVYRNEDDFLDGMDGKIYGVADTDGKFICDLHEEEYVAMTDDGTLVDLNAQQDYPAPEGCQFDVVLSDEDHRDKVYNQRIEIIKLQK
jgi:hypothetical protein